jgi:cytidylate kinase
VIVTISRMFGSGGSDVAARVARALGWSLLDNDVVDAVAQRLGLSPAEVSSRDERVPSLAERLAATLTLSSAEFAVPTEDGSLMEAPEARILSVTKQIIDEAVQHGDVVLVGRGAQCMLAERDDALHVFCYAAKASLVAYAIEHRELDPANAPTEVDRRNREREQYIRRNFNRDWRAMENYHLCVDTGRLGVETAATLVVAAAHARFNLSLASSPSRS